MSLIEKLNVFIGFRYWFFISFAFKNKEDGRFCDYPTTIGLANKRDIIKFRIIRRLAGEQFQKTLKQYPKLRGGSIGINSISYLGYFKYKRQVKK